MDDFDREFSSATQQSEAEMDIRKGPWTVEEDAMLMDYVSINGEGRWNSAARFSGLKRTGKSCRLRWLNYLRPDVRRGNITLQEQLLILELHSRWGNRWSKIAQQLPGRTDNEIKNYWRTRVQKQAKQLKCDVNSKQFRDAMRYVWVPRLLERIQTGSDSSTSGQPTTTTTITTTTCPSQANPINESGSDLVGPNFMPEISGTSSDSLDTQVSDLTDCYIPTGGSYSDNMQNGSGSFMDNLGGALDFETMEESMAMESIWNDENIWFLQQQLYDEV